MNNSFHLYATLLILLLAGRPLPTGAQNNPYKINDSLYPLYQRAFKLRAQPEGLRVADTLYAEATRKRDRKAQCLALTIPVSHYTNSSKGDYDKLKAAIDRCQEEARRNGYLQYYYYGYTNHIIWLLNHANSLRALQVSEEMKAQALRDKNDYGIVACYRAQGSIYQIRNNTAAAMNCYNEALQYMLAHCPDQDPAPLYARMAEYYCDERDYTNALQYAETAVREAKAYENRMSASLGKCEILYNMGRNEEFLSLFSRCEEEMQQHGWVQRGQLIELRVYKALTEKDYEQAFRIADSATGRKERCKLRQFIYLAQEDYRHAYECILWLQQHDDSIRRQIQSTDLAEATAQLDNERMQQQIKSLELANTTQTLKSTRLELEHAKAQAELEKSNTERSELELQNKNLELDRLNEETRHQKEILRSQHRAILLSIIGLSLLIFVGLLGYFLYRHRKLNFILKRQNKDLAVARDEAESADRMKSVFIQNMSHEIRTPLNAIVGFSQVLTTPGMEIGEEEKQEFNTLIQHNAELLTTLINDILDLAALESGKYTMKLAPAGCNELCRVEIASVAYRRPADVKLYFTSEVNDDYHLVTDEKRLRQVVTNFLTNALKHTEQGEIRLHCSLSENPGKITFSVTDTGAGIPEDKADRLFERFVKLNENKQGTGLGLNICRIIAERLNGEVKLDRSYKGGARFVFIHPLDLKPSE